jgi:hypothetical protein
MSAERATQPDRLTADRLAADGLAAVREKEPGGRVLLEFLVQTPLTTPSRAAEEWARSEASHVCPVGARVGRANDRH